MTIWRNLRYRFEYLAFRLLLCVWQILSPRGCARLAHNLAWVICTLLPRKLTRYQIAKDNLRQAFGTEKSDSEIDQIIHKMWVHLFRLLSEIAHLPRKLHLHNVHDIFQFRNRQDAVRILLTDRPVLLLSGHFGNWEMAISVFGLFGFQMGVVARELDNPYLQNWFARFRQQTGHRLIAKKSCFDGMLELLEQGGRFALLGDQDAGRGGVFVEFFGKPASTLKTIALLAQQYNALICVGCSRRLPERGEHWERFELAVEEVIDPRELNSDNPVVEITQKYTAALERAVRRSPEQYFWLHKRWKTAPGDREARRLAKKKVA
jgi:KDO2-lipid IV(A) lauroyltransferase